MAVHSHLVEHLQRIVVRGVPERAHQDVEQIKFWTLKVLRSEFYDKPGYRFVLACVAQLGLAVPHNFVVSGCELQSSPALQR